MVSLLTSFIGLSYNRGLRHCNCLFDWICSQSSCQWTGTVSSLVSNCASYHFFLSSVVLPKTSNITLKSGGKSRHSRLILGLRRKAFSLLPLKVILAVEFLETPFIKLRKLLSIPCLLGILILSDIEFCQMLFCLIDMIT